LSPAETSVDDSGPNDRLEAPESLPEDIDDDALRKYFTLTKPDLEQVAQCRGPTNRLGFAVQLCTLRWHGYFLPDTTDVPASVIERLAPKWVCCPSLSRAIPKTKKLVLNIWSASGSIWDLFAATHRSETVSCST
jgi:hypothetical protein